MVDHLIQGQYRNIYFGIRVTVPSLCVGRGPDLHAIAQRRSTRTARFEEVEPSPYGVFDVVLVGDEEEKGTSLFYGSPLVGNTNPVPTLVSPSAVKDSILTVERNSTCVNVRNFKRRVPRTW